MLSHFLLFWGIKQDTPECVIYSGVTLKVDLSKLDPRLKEGSKLLWVKIYKKHKCIEFKPHGVENDFIRLLVDINITDNNNTKVSL